MPSRWRALWDVYLQLGSLVAAAIAAPLFAVFWWLTGGPVGPHRLGFWVAMLVSIAVGVYLGGLLPAPWNGQRRGQTSRTRAERRRSRGEAERMLAQAGSHLDADRVADARLLIDSGFEEDAIKMLRPEPPPQ